MINYIPCLQISGLLISPRNGAGFHMGYLKFKHFKMSCIPNFQKSQPIRTCCKRIGFLVSFCECGKVERPNSREEEIRLEVLGVCCLAMPIY